MTLPVKRIAICLAGGYVPGLNAVITGAVKAAGELGWDVVGVHDGFDGLLFAERYRDRGIMPLSVGGAMIGAAGHTDPFRVRAIDADNQVQEQDRSDALLAAIREQKIEAVIMVADAAAMSIAWKLSRKGLNVVCVPKSVENDMASTMLSFGFNTALSFAVDMLERAREAAQCTREIGVIEVLGEHAGWLALQAGIAVCADAVLTPEIPYDLRKVAARLSSKLNAPQTSALVVVAEGAAPIAEREAGPPSSSSDSIKAALSPLASGEAGSHVINRSGRTAEAVALGLSRLTGHETYPLALGPIAKGGQPTAVDRQLGVGFGAAAVSALQQGKNGVMVAFQPPELKFVPLAEAINCIRTVPRDSVFMQIARSLGIALGD